MKKHIAESFPESDYYKEHDESECATISGVFGVCFVGMVYGQNPVYYKNNWPGISPDDHLSLERIKSLKPLDLKNIPVVEQFFTQMDMIEKKWGKIDGYLNYQGVLNNAFKIRGSEIFTDMIDDPPLAHFIFEHITETMTDLALMIMRRQRESGFYIDSICTSNCVVNMISPETYAEFILPYDKKLSKAFDLFGMHSCNWPIDPYIDAFKTIEDLAYIDFGSGSDLERVEQEFPHARKHVFYNIDNLLNKSLEEQEIDVRRMYKALGECDLSVPDIEFGMDDGIINEFIAMTKKVAQEAR
jgi:hypothetical protein